MNKHLRAFAVGLILFVASLCSLSARTVTSFDTDWRFLKADAPGAEQSTFDDSNWRTLDVPHDWSIEGPFAQTNKTGGAGAFLPSGVGWYRKAFTLPECASNQCVFIDFDGVMENSIVWINGVKLGQRPNGYVSFRYDLTPHLRFGSGVTNVIAVRADTSAQPASRWYSGAGIYRHVRLATTDRVHFPRSGIFASVSEVKAREATVRIESSTVDVRGYGGIFVVRTEILTLAGVSVASIAGEVFMPCMGGVPTRTSDLPDYRTNSVPPSRGRIVQSIFLPEPEFWSVDSPKLYRVVSTLLQGDKALDQQTNTFGIRDARFTPEQGFLLNGKKVMLKGVCLHHDGGAFGAAVPLGVWEQRLAALKELGCNAIRTSHNPVAPEFLDLCDRMGFLVMDEFFDCWTVGKNPHDYHKYFDEWSLSDLRDTVRRDRNHPSIILYSAGNEIHDTPQPELAKRILAGLVKEYKASDRTRPVTQALFRPNVSGDYTNGLADMLDVVGTNYRDKELLAAQRAKPERKIVGTEQRHDLETWLNCRDNPSHAGQFLWTGIDYLGEAKIWPRNAHASGLLDRIGWPKPLAYQRQSWWSDQPMVCIARRVAGDDLMPTDPGYGGEEKHTQVTFNDWSPRNREPHPENVEVYSNGEEVELLLNGHSLGALKKPADDSPRQWRVPFGAGELAAVARNSGKEVARQTLRTAGLATKLSLVADAPEVSPRSDDVVFVSANVLDEADVLVPNANPLVKFSVSGPGTIVAVDNGDCLSTEPFQAAQRKAYGGRCVAFIRATAPTGDIIVTAEAEGLNPSKAIIRAAGK
ncbi:MAG: hypothetical protein RLY20_1817 [Verrucomicrobiota bacterium]|jgi:beta-galactosidase